MRVRIEELSGYATDFEPGLGGDIIRRFNKRNPASRSMNAENIPDPAAPSCANAMVHADSHRVAPSTATIVSTPSHDMPTQRNVIATSTRNRCRTDKTTSGARSVGIIASEIKL